MNVQQCFLQTRHFVQSRLSPDGLFGMYFTVGAVTLVGAAWLFGGISEDLVSGDPLVRVDAIISQWFEHRALPRFALVANIASAFGSTATISVVSVIFAAALLWQRQWYWLLSFALAGGGGIVLNIGLKHLFDRKRPEWADSFATLADPGFPSGHAMMATILYGVIAIYLMLRMTSWPGQSLVAVIAAVIVLFVALSRMYLGAHYMSDVVAGMAAGIAWVAFCLTAIEALKRHRNGSTA